MTTGYTQEALDRLHRQMLERAPPLPTLDNLKTTPTVLSAAWNGSHVGILLYLQFQAGQHITVDLGCVVALELMNGINDRAHELGWWDEVEPGHAPDDRLPLFNWEYTDKTLIIVSLTTGATPEGILVHFKDSDDGSTMVFLPRSIARGVAIGMASIGEMAKWWNEDFVLQPAQMPDDLTIQRAANQLIQQYGERAIFEATERSNAAIRAGDAFNYELWQRVRGAVEEMQRTKPQAGEAINLGDKQR
jgi:hypothetical protein